MAHGGPVILSTRVSIHWLLYRWNYPLGSPKKLVAEAEGTISKQMDAGKGRCLTKVEGRAKGILIH
jgi:hypothetical protein